MEITLSEVLKRDVSGSWGFAGLPTNPPRVAPLAEWVQFWGMARYGHTPPARLAAWLAAASAASEAQSLVREIALRVLRQPAVQDGEYAIFCAEQARKDAQKAAHLLSGWAIPNERYRASGCVCAAMDWAARAGMWSDEDQWREIAPIIGATSAA